MRFWREAGLLISGWLGISLLWRFPSSRRALSGLESVSRIREACGNGDPGGCSACRPLVTITDVFRAHATTFLMILGRLG